MSALSAEQVERYRQDGLIVSPDALSPGLLARMRDALERLLDARADIPPESLICPHLPCGAAHDEAAAREWLALCRHPEILDKVEPLIGPDTINTMPLETIEAYRDHGRPAMRLEQDVDRYSGLLAHLPDLGVRLEDLAEQLEREGVEKFNKPYDASIQALREKGAE